jgi:RNA polymerase sigma-70 factor (ECF subfamily)
MTMPDDDVLARRFEAHRPHLQAVACRMLGSRGDADDAVQEAWLRFQRTDTAAVDNLGGWLTTVVARVCLDVLRAKSARHEETARAEERERALPGLPLSGNEAPDPERDLLLADAIGPALLVLLETLDPAERVAFVLHDLFDLSFEEIAPIVGRSEVAARQLASRARRRVRGAGTVDDAGADRVRHGGIVDAFLAASRDGDLTRLLAVLAPEVVLRADEDAVRTAAATRWGGTQALPRELRGAHAVAAVMKGRAHGVRRALVDGEPGAVWVMEGQTRSAFLFTLRDGRIVAIELVMSPLQLGALSVEVLD